MISFWVGIVAWQDAKDILSAIRTEVFVGEQGVLPEIEIDGLDPECVHVLAQSRNGGAIGCGRMQRGGRIGRMAVLRAWRKEGVGGAMLQALMEEARRQGEREVHLHAQSHASNFYLEHGFVIDGEEYEEASIPHVSMRAVL